MVRKSNLSSLSSEQKALVLKKYLQDVVDSEFTPFSLSHGQEAIWFLYRNDKQSNAYNVALPVQISGIVDVTALEKAAQRLIARHPSLRTLIKEEEGTPLQYVQKQQKAFLKIVDTDDWNEVILERQIKSTYDEPIDLENGPVFQFFLFRRSVSKSILLIKNHHILADGQSLWTVFEELGNLYLNEISGVDPRLQILSSSYRNYVQNQLELIASHEGEKQLSFWRQYVSDEYPAMRLSAYKTRPRYQTLQGDVVEFVVSKPLLKIVRQLAVCEGTTLYIVLHAVFQILLYLHSGQKNFFIGSPLLGRNRWEYERVVGYFVNTLPIKAEIVPGGSFRDVLKRMAGNMAGPLQNQDFPFSLLIQKLDLHRDLSNSPLFQVLFSLLKPHGFEGLQDFLTSDVDSEKIKWGGLNINFFSLLQNEGQFDLVLEIIEGKDKLLGAFKYDKNLIERKDVEQLSKDYLALLESVVSNPGISVSSYLLLDEPQRDVLLKNFNSSRVSYPRDSRLESLFTAQSRLTPEVIAVECGDVRLSYRSLDRLSTQLSYYLRERQDVCDGDRVSFILDGSWWSVVSMLAIVKSGASYVPIDASYPAERIAYVLKDSSPKVLLVEHSQGGIDYSFASVGIVILDAIRDELEAFCADSFEVRGDAVSLAYIMYTSGTTGVPKGVMIPHRGVVRLVKSANYVELEAGMNLLQTGSLSFDASTFEIWGMLLNGGTVHILQKTSLLNVSYLEHYIKDKNIDLMWYTSGWFNQLVDEQLSLFSTLRCIIVGGDKLSPKHVDLVRRAYPSLKVINGYGPTENTTFSICHHLDGDIVGSIPLGKPISNTSVYILNDELELIALGMEGEICLSGDGLSLGYWGQELLTKEKFIANPYVEGEWLYLTGDIGKWRTDGTIEYLGRRDTQVKLRGYRIELDEIATVVMKSGFTEDVHVVLRELADSDKDLICYVKLKAGYEIQDVSGWVRTSLPGYMIPAGYVSVSQFPLTTNGKVDLRGLPAPDSLSRTDQYVGPRTHREHELVQIWGSVLRVEGIGVRDNFFEIGGHSLKATRMLSAIYKQMGVHIEIKDLFSYPTIESLSIRIGQIEGATYQPIPLAEKKEFYPLSHAQKRIWLIQQSENSGIAYTIPFGLILKGHLSSSILDEAFKKLITRHEILRTTFVEIAGEPYQKICSDSCSFTLNFLDLKREKHPLETLNLLVKAEVLNPFDLSSGPLLRSSLFQLSENEYAFTLFMHHIINDAWSMEVLLREVLTYYSAFSRVQISVFPDLKLQYKDFSEWQNRRISSGYFDNHRDYWLEKLRDIRPLNLKTDYPRQGSKTFSGDMLSVLIDSEIVSGATALSRKHNTTVFSALTASLIVLLNKYSGQNEISLGTPVSGRNHDALSDQLGFHVNTIVLHVNYNASDCFERLLDHVKKDMLESYQHAEYPFDQLVDEYSAYSRSPLFDVMVLFQHEDYKEIQTLARPIEITPFDIDLPASKFDLTFNFKQKNSQLFFQVEYNTDLFSPGRIMQMVGHYQKLLYDLVSNPGISVSSHLLLDEPQRDVLLKNFNSSRVSYPRDSRLESLFTAQSRLTPEVIAVECGDVRLSYRSLDRLSTQLSYYLRERQDVCDGDRVSFILDGSWWSVVSMLAIVKSGASYVPIDASYPAERIAYVLKDSSPKVLLVEHSQGGIDYSFASVGIVILDAIRDELEAFCADSFEVRGDAVSLAYIMYTSGTTGVPKGVMIPHRGVVRLVKSANYVELEAGMNLLQTGSLSFDASTFEIWGMLLNGGTVHILQKTSLLNVSYLEHYIKDKNIDLMWYTSGWFNQLVDEQLSLFSTLRCIIVGGDKLSPKHVDLVRRAYPSLKVINGYGPTENTTFSICHHLDGDIVGSIPLGKPISNTSVYILNDELELIALGMEGEICLSGDGLSLGYWGQELLTKEKFIANPYVEGEWLYLTGDIGKWRTDGTIEYLGRRDTQVKLRGYRIELDEIATVVMKSGFTEDVHVVLRELADSDKDLICYVKLKAGYEIQDVSGWVRTSLPGYMIPAGYVSVSQFPLTTNGKVDLRGLPAPDSLSRTDQYVGPRTHREHELVQIWGSVLRVDGIGVRDNFFEIGGHSLKATRMLSAIYKQMGVHIEIKDLFSYPTIESLSIRIGQIEGATYQPIPLAEKKEFYPLSHAQKHMWVMQQSDVAGTRDNSIVCSYVFDKPFDIVAFSSAMLNVVERHEILRTIFVTKNGLPVQQIIEVDQIRVIPIEKIFLPSGRGCDLATLIELSTHCEFKLDKWPLFRVQVVKTAEQEAVLVFSIHHIITDGLSLMIFFDELLALLDNKQLEKPDLQYKDFVGWQNNLLSSSENLPAKEYWRSKLEGKLPVINFPSDARRPPVKSLLGAVHEFTLNRSLAIGISQMARHAGTTVNTVLVALLKILIHKYTGCYDLLLGTPAAARVHPSLENQLGLYVNTIVLRTLLKPHEDFLSFLEQVKKTTSEAFRFQGYPFDCLIQDLAVRIDRDRYPVFDIGFTFHNQIDYRENKIVIENKTGISIADLWFHAYQKEEEIEMMIVYDTALFKKESIASLGEKFVNLSTAICLSPNQKIADVDIADTHMMTENIIIDLAL